MPPSAPTGFKTTSITRTSVTLAWDAATDNVGVTGYKLYEYNRVSRQWVLRKDAIIGLTTRVTRLKPNSKHRYAVAADDAAGNISLMSALP